MRSRFYNDAKRTVKELFRIIYPARNNFKIKYNKKQLIDFCDRLNLLGGSWQQEHQDKREQRI